MHLRAVIGSFLLASACDCGGDSAPQGGALVVMPEVIEFGEVVVGLAGRRTLILENRGRDLLRVESARSSDGIRRDVRLDRVPAALPGGAAAEVDLVFAPSSPGTRSGEITVITDGDPRERIVIVSGTAVEPSLVASPPRLDFGRVVVGEARTATVTVTNEGSASVNVDGITPDLETSEEFEVGPYNIRTLEPGEAFRFTITFRPAFPGRALGRIVIGDDEVRPERLSVEVIGEGADGELELEPRQIDFTGVLVGETRTRFFDIRNTGTATHTVESMELEDAGGAYAIVTSTAAATPATPFDLAPGEERRVHIRYAPDAIGLDLGAVLITSPALRSGVSVSLYGDPQAAPRARLEVSPPVVDFGGVEVGTDSRRPVEIASGPVEVRIASAPRIEPPDAPFALVNPPPAGVLVPHDSHLFEVRFSPVSEGPVEARLVVTSDDLEAPVREVQLLGRGALEASADVDVRPHYLDAGLVPRGMEILRHIEIFNQGGAPLGVDDVVVTEDAGGRFRLFAPFQPVSVGPGEGLAVGVTYADPLGIAETHTGTVTISTDDPDHPTVRVRLHAGTVQPRPDEDVDIAVRLSWNTQGTDLDLHLIRVGTAFFDQPADCCWCNPNARWQELVDGRPLLDRNVRDGIGPETIQLVAAETGLYTVVVHYRGPIGGGPSTLAEVEIRTFGSLGQLRTRTLAPGQRWVVGSISFAAPLRQGTFTASTLPLDHPLVTRCF